LEAAPPGGWGVVPVPGVVPEGPWGPQGVYVVVVGRWWGQGQGQGRAAWPHQPNMLPAGACQCVALGLGLPPGSQGQQVLLGLQPHGQLKV
jgi:hypothetical protein